MLLRTSNVTCHVQDENLGQNIAVLRGHTAPVTLIDFHPTVNSALISASTDGSVRLWDAKDQHFAPLMLLPSDNIGTFGSSIRLAATAAAAAGPVARRSLTGILGAGSAAAPGVAAEDAAEVSQCQLTVCHAIPAAAEASFQAPTVAYQPPAS